MGCSEKAIRYLSSLSSPTLYVHLFIELLQLSDTLSIPNGIFNACYTIMYVQYVCMYNMNAYVSEWIYPCMYGCMHEWMKGRPLWATCACHDIMKIYLLLLQFCSNNLISYGFYLRYEIIASFIGFLLRDAVRLYNISLLLQVIGSSLNTEINSGWIKKLDKTHDTTVKL